MSAVPDQEALADAREAGLRYVADQAPGIQRRREGDSVVCVGPDGRKVHDEEMLEWIRSLVIPPAWTEVWISPVANGHLQATGRHARDRKQYRYHQRWRAVRDANKYP